MYALPDDEGENQRLDPPALSRLEDIRSPALILVGDLDTPDILRIANILEERISGAQRETLIGTAHLPNMEEPETFNRVVLQFLGGQ